MVQGPHSLAGGSNPGGQRLLGLALERQLARRPMGLGGAGELCERRIELIGQRVRLRGRERSSFLEAPAPVRHPQTGVCS